MNKIFVTFIILGVLFLAIGISVYNSNDGMNIESEEIVEDSPNVIVEDSNVEEVIEEVVDSPEVPSQPEIIPLADSSEKTTHTVKMVDFAFEPNVLNVKAGDKVVWVNEGKGVHYVMTTYTNRILNSGNVAPGKSWSYTFSEGDIGSNYYFSPIYTGMQAKIIVE